MLKEYLKKRKLKSSKEPSNNNERVKKGVELIFVIQRHQASHLHYDFRLEVDGVLKSWAIPKEPSMNPKVKRLAIRVEDHPLSYANFQGLIPEGNYGAGMVEIWDQGIYKPLFKVVENTTEESLKMAIEKGHLDFVLKGKKMKGRFSLIKYKGKEENAWLLIKNSHDEEIP